MRQLTQARDEALMKLDKVEKEKREQEERARVEMSKKDAKIESK